MYDVFIFKSFYHSKNILTKIMDAYKEACKDGSCQSSE